MRKARTDANQTEIVNAFRNAGCSVSVTSSVHSGYPDLTVGSSGISITDPTEDLITELKDRGFNVVRGVNFLVEVKDGAKAPSQRELTPPQVKFQAEWAGQFIVITEVTQIEDLVKKS